MEEKKDIQVAIDDKVITLSSVESEEYMQKVALYLNNKLSECKATKQYRKLPAEYKSLHLSLNIADDLFKAKEKIEQMQRQIEKMEKQIYDLQHEQIETQIKYDSSQKL